MAPYNSALQRTRNKPRAAEGERQAAFMGSPVPMRTKLLVIAGFTLFCAIPVAVLWLVNYKPNAAEEECAARCKAVGRAHRLVPKANYPVGRGKPQMECSCM